MSSHRRKSAECPKFDMVWIHRSPIPVGRRGVNFLVQMISTCLAARRGRGSGVHPNRYRTQGGGGGARVVKFIKTRGAEGGGGEG
jgi:hypothetical protein